MIRLIGRFSTESGTIIGELASDTVVVLSRSDNLADHLNTAAAATVEQDRISIDEVSWLPPLASTGRVLAVAVNYAGHARETGATPPDRPLFFYKPATSFVGHDGTLDSHPDITQQFDYEGEVGVVIGRTCSNVSPEDALDYVAGIVALDDGSARDRQRIPAGDSQLMDWVGAKALDHSSAIGPVIALGDEVLRGLRDCTLEVTTHVNGAIRQQGRIDDLIFPVESLIAHASTHMTLVPGDVIATGTPSGVGLATGAFLEPGDVLSVQVSLLPPLTVEVGK